jgi:hypothetical protein
MTLGSDPHRVITRLLEHARGRTASTRRDAGVELAVGQFRQQTLLGSQALYRICGLDDTFATVAVVGAPGLTQGQTLRLQRSAVAGMPVSAPSLAR